VEQELTDERLAWLAVRDTLTRKAGRGSLLTRILAGRTTVVMPDGKIVDSGDRGKERTSGKMAAYAFAVDDVAQRLSKEERQTLRSTGAVPDWFLDAVRERYQEIRADKG
jgi:hypothetical protein